MKRRQFFTKAVKAGGAIWAASHLSPINVWARGKQKDKLGIALVGLGNYSSGQLGPALLETEHCYLAGIVTGTPSKEKEWAEKYNIPEKNVYNYENFDSISSNEDIDIIYVVLPNSMHAEYTIRAAEAGKHVICEKPMATSSEDCRKMIAACEKAGKKLAIGYRLHYDPYNLKMMELGQRRKYGKLNTISSGFAFPLKDPSRWRLDKEMAGGGPLMDVGVYSVQGCIYTAGELPVEITAKDVTQDREFFEKQGVEGSLEWEMHFASGALARCKTSYEEQYSFLKAEAEQGVFQLEPSFFYGGNKGSTPEGPLNLTEVNQQARQMDDFALCVKRDRPSIVSGEMGLRDMMIMEKIYEAAESGKAVKVQGLPNALHKV